MGCDQLVYLETKKYVKYAEYLKYVKHVKYVHWRRWRSEKVNRLHYMQSLVELHRRDAYARLCSAKFDYSPLRP